MTITARCPYCQSRDGFDDPVRCPGCAAIYHRDCWLEFGGCSVPGCAQAPAELTPPAAAAVPAASVFAPSVVAQSGPPASRTASSPAAQVAQSAPVADAAGRAGAALPSAGWFPDPDGADRQRWWDGRNWTGHYYPPS